jgi:hypothetical protein
LPKIARKKDASSCAEFSAKPLNSALLAALVLPDGCWAEDEKKTYLAQDSKNAQARAGLRSVAGSGAA